MDKNSLAVAIFDRYAHEYQERYMDISLYANTLDVFCKALPNKNASILETACGPGNITRYLLDKMPGLDILATDLSPNMLELAAENNPEAKVQLMDVRDISHLTQKYDSVVCGFGLPYLTKEEAKAFIDGAIYVLNPNGVLYVSTMEGDYSTSGLTTNSKGESVYMYYHEEAYLKESLVKGMDILLTERKHYLHNGTETTDLIIVATKKG